ncbi:hypothetical protein B0H13DRAFT_2370986 [Mycena leptocephala]|nr:hypothetical protein B0H13DRAFT_2370986 [Mycena leptocephala]
MSSPSFDADSTLGALLIGTLVSYVLFGVATTQTYIYYGRFPDDSRAMKATVALVWCAEFAHAICIGCTIYSMVITNYGHPERLVQLPNSLVASTVIGSLVSYFIQSFFAYRIYTLSRSLIIPCICWALSLFRVIPPNVVMLKFGIHEPLGDFLSSWGWLFDTVWAVSAVNDLFIASTLVVLLYRRRSLGLKSTAAVVDKMITWTIETGVVTSIASIVMMSVFLSMRFNFIWMALFVIIPRRAFTPSVPPLVSMSNKTTHIAVFSNSFFASLNSRAALRLANDHEFTLPNARPAVRPRFHLASIPRFRRHALALDPEFLDTDELAADEFLDDTYKDE